MRVLIPLLLVLAVAVTATASAQEAKIFPFPYEKVELENGFKAYLIKTPSPGQIVYITVVRTGSRDEYEPGYSGYAHLFEHMMFRGTKKYPGPVYDQMLTGIGADHNAFTSDDLTAYYVVAAGDSLETVVELESDRFQNLYFEEPEYRKETGAVLGEYYQGRANPFSLLREALRKTAFHKHTYNHTTIGYGDDVKAMPDRMEYSISFHRRYYRPENCVLLIAGDVDYEAAKQLIQKHYGSWETGYTPPQITPEPEQTEAREIEVKFKGRTLPLLTIAYKAPAWSPTDKMAVACNILGRIAYGQNSEIYKRLVIKERKVQMLNSDFGLSRDPGLLTITTMVTNPADVSEIQAAIEETAAKFRNEPCDAKMLEDTKRRMKYEFLMELETPQGVAFSLLMPIVYTGGIEAVEDYYGTVAGITVEDIQAAAQAYLVDNAKTVARLFPEEGGQ